MSVNIAQSVIDAANAYGVDPRLALEVALQESRLNPTAVSPAGAVGVFQLMPATAAAYGIDPRDPQANIEAGVQELARLLARYNDPAKALAAYNWGTGRLDAAIEKYGDSWYTYAPRETQTYVPTILNNVQSQYEATFTPEVAAQQIVDGTANVTGYDPDTVRNVLLAVGVMLLVIFGGRMLKDANA